MNNDGQTGLGSSDFMRVLSLIDVVLTESEAAMLPPYNANGVAISAATFIGQVATAAFIHALAMDKAGTEPTRILITGEPESVVVSGERGDIICILRVIAPIPNEFVFGLVVRALDQLRLRLRAGVIDESALDAAKGVYGYDEALWIAEETFAGRLHGDDELACPGDFMATVNGGRQGEQVAVDMRGGRRKA